MLCFGLKEKENTNAKANIHWEGESRYVYTCAFEIRTYTLKIKKREQMCVEEREKEGNGVNEK